MANKSVLVTGAGGYIGRHLTAALLDRGHPVTAVVRRADALVDPRADLVVADVLASGFRPESLWGRTPPAMLAHLAWQDGFRHQAPSHLERLPDHYRFLSAAVADGVGKLVVPGSMHEICYWEGAVTATTPTNPTSLYGIAKNALRQAVFSQLADRASLQWLRFYYLTGDDRRNQSVFAKMLDAAEQGRLTFPFTSGRNLYDFIDVVEASDQAAAVMDSDLTGIINCCSGRPVSLRERAESFIRDNNLRLELEFGAFPDRPYDSPGTWGDAEIIDSLLAQGAQIG